MAGPVQGPAFFPAYRQALIGLGFKCRNSGFWAVSGICHHQDKIPSGPSLFFVFRIVDGQGLNGLFQAFYSIHIRILFGFHCGKNDEMVFL
jgi:hypothetical protein